MKYKKQIESLSCSSEDEDDNDDDDDDVDGDDGGGGGYQASTSSSKVDEDTIKRVKMMVRMIHKMTLMGVPIQVDDILFNIDIKE